jgi:hypothetical protein
MSEIVDTNQLQKKQSFNTWRGKKIRSSSNSKYILKEISIENLFELYNSGTLIIPEFQRDVNESKIIQMIKTYQSDSENFSYLTNPLQIAKLVISSDPYISSELYFLIDGQHRFYMYKQLYETDTINGHIFINFIRFDSIEEMQIQYMKFNADNPDIYFDIGEIQGYQNYIRYQEFTKSISKLYKKYFKSEDTELYSLETFVKQLELREYLDYFEKIDQAINYINSKNRSFYSKYYLEKSIQLFKSKKIQDCIKDKKIFSIKSNNFLDWLMCEDQDVPVFVFYHTIKKTKTGTNKTKKIVNNFNDDIYHNE